MEKKGYYRRKKGSRAVVTNMREIGSENATLSVEKAGREHQGPATRVAPKGRGDGKSEKKKRKGLQILPVDRVQLKDGKRGFG